MSIKLEPPKLINGNVIPFVGSNPVETPIFIKTCRAINTPVPYDTKQPKE